MPVQPKVLLIQARLESDPMRQHELNCFCEQTSLSSSSFQIVNMVTEKAPANVLKGIDLVMVGGSGDFSFVRNELPFRQDMYRLILDVVAQRLPMFASCFGFQAIVDALGGKLGRMEGDGEVGSHEMMLTPEGKQDPLFGKLPPTFIAQLGHLDEAVELPDNCIHLAQSLQCKHQALRIRNAPVVATQFHPELTMQANFDRYIHYITHYKKPGTSIEEAIRTAKEHYVESPEASSLLGLFMEQELGYKAQN